MPYLESLVKPGKTAFRAKMTCILHLNNLSDHEACCQVM